jgi:RNA polymerase sigma-70 factor (ECF subfamily)
MKKINLRDYYPFYTSDNFIDVPDEVATLLKEFARSEAAYRMRTYRHKAYYSLDRDDGIQHDILSVNMLPDELYERKVTMEQLYSALALLPDKQAQRIYSHYFFGLSKSAIAKAEHVSRITVGQSITRGLNSLKLYLEKNNLD